MLWAVFLGIERNLNWLISSLAGPSGDQCYSLPLKVGNVRVFPQLPPFVKFSSSQVAHFNIDLKSKKVSMDNKQMKCGWLLACPLELRYSGKGTPLRLWVRILPLLFTSCATLGKLLNISGLVSLPLKWRQQYLQHTVVMKLDEYVPLIRGQIWWVSEPAQKLTEYLQNI